MPHVELVRDSDDRDLKVIWRMVQLLRAAESQEDPTVGGEMVHAAILAGARHIGDPILATPWTTEQDGDIAADLAREEEKAA